MTKMVSIFILILVGYSGYCQLGYSLFYSRQQIREDLNMLKTELENYHPGLYQYIDQADFDEIFDASNLSADSSAYSSIYRHLSSIPNLVGDMHLSISHSDYVYKFIKDDLILFPFSVFIQDGELYINKNFSSNQAVGTGVKILSINEVTSSDLIQDFQKLLPRDGKNVTFTEYLIKSYFSLLYAEFQDTPAFFLILVEDQKGRKGKISVPAVLIEDQSKQYEERYNPSKKKHGTEAALKFKFLSNSLAYLNITSFNIDKNRADPFLQAIFGKMRRKNVSKLVLDLRNNTGGSVAVACELLSHLIPVKFQPFVNYSINEKTRYTYQTKTLIKSSTIYEDYLRLRVEPKRKPYPGEIVVLINGGSASASILVAQMLRSHINAKIIGQEGGSNPFTMNAGSFRSLSLPNTHSKVRIPLSNINLNTSEPKHVFGLIPDKQLDRKMNIDLPIEDIVEFVVADAIK